MDETLLATCSLIFSSSSREYWILGMEGHIGNHLLEQQFIGGADHARLGHLFDFEQGALDLKGADQMARRIYHIVGPAEKPVISFIVPVRRVSGVIIARS